MQKQAIASSPNWKNVGNTSRLEIGHWAWGIGHEALDSSASSAPLPLFSTQPKSYQNVILYLIALIPLYCKYLEIPALKQCQQGCK